MEPALWLGAGVALAVDQAKLTEEPRIFPPSAAHPVRAIAKVWPIEFRWPLMRRRALNMSRK